MPQDAFLSSGLFVTSMRLLDVWNELYSIPVENLLTYMTLRRSAYPDMVALL